MPSKDKFLYYRAEWDNWRIEITLTKAYEGKGKNKYNVTLYHNEGEHGFVTSKQRRVDSLQVAMGVLATWGTAIEEGRVEDIANKIRK
jgi:hypothetical protein